jgi:hypothetical protein
MAEFTGVSDLYNLVARQAAGDTQSIDRQVSGASSPNDIAWWEHPLAAAGAIPGGKGLMMAGAMLPGVKGVLRRGGRGAGAPAPTGLMATPTPGAGHNGPPSDPLDMYRAEPGSDPRYLGQAEDRSSVTHLRYAPAKTTPKMDSAIGNLRTNEGGIKDALLADIKRGQELGGDDWYNSEEMRDWFVKELGEKRGDTEWREFMDLMGAASTGNKVDTNIGTASMYRSLGVDAKDLAAREMARPGTAPKILPAGYGHKMQKNHAANTVRVLDGDWVPTPEFDVATQKLTTSPAKGSHLQNPKPKGFANSFLGNKINMAADLHFTRYMGMASGRPEWLQNGADVARSVMTDMLGQYGNKAKKYFKTGVKDGKPTTKLDSRKMVEDGVAQIDDMKRFPTVWQGRPADNEYAAFEGYINELADELGMSANQVQANLWMGAADRTNVDPSSQGTFMELIRARADKRAKAEGTTREIVLRRFIRERGLLQAAPAAALGGAAAGGLMQNDGGGY